MLIFVTIASLLLALTTSLIAWRVLRAERRRSAARVEALAHDIHDRAPAPGGQGGIDELPLRTPVIAVGAVSVVNAANVANIRNASDQPQPRSMFAGQTPATASGSRWGLAFAIGGFAVAAAAALAIVLGSDTPGARVALASTDAAQASPAVSLPLELTALSHERDGRQLTVRGVVRNPATGREMDGLAAVVVVFNDAGNVVATARAPVTSPALIAGGESAFSILVPDVNDIARYRVSFRSGDRVVEHVDRRSTP